MAQFDCWSSPGGGGDNAAGALRPQALLRDRADSAGRGR